MIGSLTATSLLGMFKLSCVNIRNILMRHNRSTQNVQQEMRLLIDLDVERGRPARAQADQVRVVIRQTKSKIDLNNIKAYLDGKCPIGPHVFDAINFLDHLIREWPSTQHVSIKRSYFSRDYGDKYALGGGIEAMRGIYQSIRMAEVSFPYPTILIHKLLMAISGEALGAQCGRFSYDILERLELQFDHQPTHRASGCRVSPDGLA